MFELIGALILAGLAIGATEQRKLDKEYEKSKEGKTEDECAHPDMDCS